MGTIRGYFGLGEKARNFCPIFRVKKMSLAMEYLNEVQNS
jgi:hypothetical protein